MKPESGPETQNQDPVKPKRFKQQMDESPVVEEFIRNLRRMRLRRKAFDGCFRLAVMIATLVTPLGWKALTSTDMRRFYTDRNFRLGLLEDSILSPDLWLPNQGQTSLEYLQAEAGRYYAYDFHKIDKMGIKERPRDQWKAGRLVTMMPDEIKDNPPDQYTPTYYVDILNFTDVMYLDFPRLGDAINDGLLRKTDYTHAYQKAGYYEKYRQFIVLAGISEIPVYQVTPKGNGLVGIMGDGGNKVPRLKTTPVLQPTFEHF